MSLGNRFEISPGIPPRIPSEFSSEITPAFFPTIVSGIPPVVSSVIYSRIPLEVPSVITQGAASEILHGVSSEVPFGILTGFLLRFLLGFQEFPSGISLGVVEMLQELFTRFPQEFLRKFFSGITKKKSWKNGIPEEVFGEDLERTHGEIPYKADGGIP